MLHSNYPFLLTNSMTQHLLQFSKGINGVCSEMVSDIKGCAAAIYGLQADWFVRGYAWEKQTECRDLLVNPRGTYTKFAPFLFLNDKNGDITAFLKTAVLVNVSLTLTLTSITCH